MKTKLVFDITSWLFGVYSHKCHCCTERVTTFAFGPVVLLITTGGMTDAEIFRRDVELMAGFQKRRNYQPSEN